MLSNLVSALSAALPLALLPLACATATPAPARPASAETSRALALRYFDLWNQRDVRVADEIIAPDVVGHINSVTLHHLESFKERVQSLGKIYSQSQFSVDAIVADGDAVAVRWTQRATHTGAYLGPQTSGKQVTVTGTNLFRISAGKIAEIWVSSDDLGELQQLGVQVPNGV